LRPLLFVHNLLLSICSMLLLGALVHTLHARIEAFGFNQAYCQADKTNLEPFVKGRLVFIYYINYVFKFVELIDPVFLPLRGKPTPFLHVFHHAATMLLVLTQLRSQTCLQWIIIGLNLLIHTFMYMHYALSALKVSAPWKQYLTRGHILQFVVGTSLHSLFSFAC
jgi:hypothetical protein